MKTIKINYRMATDKDIDLLVLERLKHVEVDEKDDKYPVLKENCYSYFRKAFANDTCDVLLAEDSGKCVGTGIVFYYDSVPSAFDVTGKKAYITSMYVDPNYRRQGIGMTILEKIVAKAEERGYKMILLNASDMGKPMYEKMGFVDSVNGMFLDKRNE